MKQKLLLNAVFVCMLVTTSFSQVPQLINFEAVVRDSIGNSIPYTFVKMRLSIMDSTYGNPVYSEIDTGTTKLRGLFSTYIGAGQVVTGNFKSINWSTGKKYLLVETALGNSTTFLNLGLTQLVSVPYALYADSAGKSIYPKHLVGDHYGGGIIFWADSLGQHGLIADTVDLDTGIVWNNGSYMFANASRNGRMAGKYNTERIIIKQGIGQYAAQLCADYQGGGFSDWYLPSVNELNLLYQQQTIVGGFTTDVYWSSGELSNQQATGISFNGGSFTPSDKANTHRVRAIRAF
jgi:hypothetical protein